MWDDPMQTYSICPKQSCIIPEIQNRQIGKEGIGTIRATIKDTDNSKTLPPHFEYKNDQKLTLDHCLLGGLIAASAFQVSQIILRILSFTAVSQDILLTKMHLIICHCKRLYDNAHS